VFVRREHCRSPISQGIFEDVVLRREGLGGEVFVDSAGTDSWHIEEPPYEGRSEAPPSVAWTSAASGGGSVAPKTATPSTTSL
jgi:protein-tyrosine-phosphatase